MAKVLRLHKGSNNIVDWQNSNVIGFDHIAEIEDPEEHSSEKEITSIPSPFARIDLVRTAFNELVNNPKFELNGSTVYHKMVSDSFDVGEIFFNIKRYSDKFQILYWDKNTHLEELLYSDIEEHRTVGRTLNMFMKQDCISYNFDKLNRIYLLNYIGPDKPAQMNIVGATSPCTLFFSSANDLGYITKHISMGQNKIFDDNYCPLYKRDFEFIKYLWLFRSNYNNFSKDFRAISAYFDKTYARLTNDQKKLLDEIDYKNIEQYDKINFQDTTNKNEVEINGMILHQRPKLSALSSGFEINSSICHETPPLVLPIEYGNTYNSLLYTQDLWGKKNKAPSFNPTYWANRELPDDGSEYPYLTVSDFLTDTIIKSPFELNKAYYFDGNVETSKGSYLLPITDTFFEFFTVKDLMGTVTGEKKMFELRENAGGITATIRIPIKGNSKVKYIEYQRNYFENNSPDKSLNKGALITKIFGMGLFPCIAYKAGDSVHYRVPLFDKGQKDIELSFYFANKKTELKDRVVRREKDINDGVCSIETYVINKEFDRIQVNIGSHKAIIIPMLKPTSGSAKYTFAIDFGTSNTHIEYSRDKSPSKAFDITSSEQQMIRLHRDYPGNPDIYWGFDDNNIPDTIGKESLYKLPLRTAFAEYNMIDYDMTTHALASGNIAFRYEKAAIQQHNKVSTDLKWSVEKKDQVNLFLANIYLLIRNKVLLNGGDLSATKIVWFYPASMTEGHCNKLKKIWENLYLDYIGNDLSNLIPMSESVAPYSFYAKKKGAKSNVVSIDIGGGTTDVYVVDNRVPKMLSSFRFAANSIFGDGYGWDSDQNGFVKLFKDNMIDSLAKNGLSELIDAFNSIEETKVSSDIAAFFFSLSQNEQVKEKGINSLNFLEKLENHSQIKYVFILFYTAVLYYVARLMRAKNLQMPLTIAFSGNGSKTLRILSSDKGTLAKYIKLIFEKVYNETYLITNDLEIIYEENPKEATCKGGILSPDKQDFDCIEDLKCSLLGSDKQTLIEDGVVEKIDDALLKKVVNEVEDFIDFTFDINKDNKNFFANKFDVDPRIVDKMKSMCRMNLLEYAKSGVDNQMQELQSWQEDLNKSSRTPEQIGETLFFLPIIGMLNSIAREIANNKNN